MAVRHDNQWQSVIIFLSVFGYVVQPIIAEDLYQERIVGGDIARPGDWPWMAITFKAGQQWCGGTLIDQKHILTAGHCFYDAEASDVIVHLGDYNTATDDEVRHIERQVVKIILGPDYSNEPLINDITILTMDTPVEYTQAIQPVRLASGSQLYTGKIGTVIGWGSTVHGGFATSVLRQVSIPIISNSECELKFADATKVIDTYLCVAYPGKSSCVGDSGGPLMVNEGGQWVQVGIVSWGYKCGSPQHPSVYTRVTKYVPWIRENLK